MIGGTILWNNTADRYDPPYPNPTGYVKIELDLFNLLKTKEGIRPSQDLIKKNRSIDFIGDTYVDEKGTRISLLLACKRYLNNDNRTSQEKMDFKKNWEKAYNLRVQQDKLKGDKSHIFFTNLFKEFNEKLDGSLIRVTGVPPKRISRTTESKGLSPDRHPFRSDKGNSTSSTSSTTSSLRSRSSLRPRRSRSRRSRSRSTSRQRRDRKKVTRRRSRSRSRQHIRDMI